MTSVFSVFWYLNISKSCAKDQTEDFGPMSAGSFEMFLYKYFYGIWNASCWLQIFRTTHIPVSWQGDASLHHNCREDEDQKVTEPVLMRCGQGVAPAAKTPQTSQDRNVLAMFWARPRWTMWRSRRGEAPTLVTAVYYDYDQAVTVSCVMLRVVNEPSRSFTMPREGSN